MAEEPTDGQLTTRLREMLKVVDLQTTTERQLRKALEQEFGADLSNRKEIVRAEVTRYLDEHQAEEEAEGADADDGEPEEDEPRPAKRKAGGGFGSGYLSEEAQAFLGEETLPRTQVVKRLWDYIRANDLQNPKDRRKIVLDEALGKLFKPPLTMFNMNKQLSRHCTAPEVWSDDDGDEAPAPKARKTDGEASKSKKRKKNVDPDAPKRGGGFTKKLPLSEDMAEFMGMPEASRAELVSHFWKYVKERGLQDPSNKQIILADEQLFKLTGERKFPGFGVAKYFKSHIRS